MDNEKPSSTRSIPLSGYFDLALSLALPFVGVSFVLLLVFWTTVRSSISEAALVRSYIGIATVSLIVGVINAVRYYRKSYRR